MKDLKYIKELISPVIAYFINISVKKYQYPEELKKSIIRPVSMGPTYKGQYNNLGIFTFLA